MVDSLPLLVLMLGVTAVAFFSLRRRTQVLEQKLGILADLVVKLREELRARADGPRQMPPEASIAAEAAVPASAVAPFQEVADSPWDLPVVAPMARPVRQSKLRLRLDALRVRLSANWTGLLGAVILVTGVAFFGVLASLYIGPEGRFGLILGAAAVAFGLDRWLARRPAWAGFAAWLGGISGALALFACLGAGNIDGLKFLASPAAALAMLLVGIAANIGFAVAARSQGIAALHVVLSLAALATAPATLPVLVVGAAVTLVGIGLSHRHRWDVNLLVILVVFAAFHAYWLEQALVPLAASRPLGGTACVVLALAAALVHYRRDYQTARAGWMPLSVHLVNWAFLGVNIVRYATGSPWAVPALALAAVVAGLLARAAKHRGIRWLHLTDTLVAQVIALYAILSLGRLHAGDLDIALVALAELGLMQTLSNVERDVLLARIFYVAEGLAFLVVLLLGAVAATDGSGFEPGVALRLAAAGTFVIAQLQLAHARGLAVDHLAFLTGARTSPAPGWAALSLLTVAGPLALLVSYVAVRNEIYAASAGAAALGLLFKHRARNETYSLTRAVLAATALLHVLIWWQMRAHLGDGPAAVALTGVPLLALDLLLLPGATLWARAERRGFARPVVYLAGGQVMVLAYLLTSPVSDFVPGVAYLLLSLVALETGALLLRREAAVVPHVEAPGQRRGDYTLHVGYGFLAAFGVRHVLVDLQSEARLGPVPIRLALEIFGLAVIVYWLAYAPALARVSSSRTVRSVGPRLWEAWMGLLTLTVAVEVDAVWQPVAWAALACAFFAFARRRGWPPRIAHYSWFYLLAAAVHLAFVASTFVVPGEAWYQQARFVGPLAIALQLLYVAQVQRAGGFPPAPTRLAKLLAGHRHLCVFYPVIAGVGVFLFWRFEHAVLTLLWVGEVFLVFALGIYLKEKHFVQVALAFLAFCIARLVGFDLAQTDLSVRAGVFVGVGVLMLGINALYRRFSGRLA